MLRKCVVLFAMVCAVGSASAGTSRPCAARLVSGAAYPSIKLDGIVTGAHGARLVLRGGDGETEAAAAEEGKKEVPAAEEKKGFVLDDWKRLYSNTEDTKSIVGQFWEMYDKEGWSIWFTEYKNNADYEKRIMASNLISGWMQRLDGTGTRKVAFGNVHVFGDEPDLEIAGCWLVKGNEIPQEFKDVADYEQWDWIKVDTEDAAMREAVNAYMCWEGEFGKGRKWASGKTYK